MNFLNEIANEFPTAVSLAAGRPTDRFLARLDSGVLASALLRYEQHAAQGGNFTGSRTRILQYGPTAGIIADLVAEQLHNDEHVPAHADRMLITAGCQEALALCLSALCPDSADVLLVCNPTYIGITGAAQACGVKVLALSSTSTDLAENIEESVARLRESGRTARAFYVIPDFDNPTGRVLDESQRRSILAVCARHRIVVLEDNPYGMFRFDGQDILPMAALDKAGSVIYLSTFSKTLSPAARVGAATLPETLFGDRAAGKALWQELVQRKSFVTVNTSQITQAIVGGILLEQNCSLRRWIRPALDEYRAKRDLMLSELQEVLPAISDEIRWNCPSGGFFLSLELPFEFDADSVTECATHYGVIVMPMAFFALDSSQDRRVRLAFSSAEPQQIRKGVSALGRYVADRMGRESRSVKISQRR